MANLIIYTIVINIILISESSCYLFLLLETPYFNVILKYALKTSLPLSKTLKHDMQSRCLLQCIAV